MVAADQEFIPLVLGVGDKLENTVILLLVLNRTYGCALFGTIADFHSAGIGCDCRRKLIVNIFVDINALGRNADLTRIIETRPEQLFRHFRDIRIRQHDRGIISAQLQRDPLQILRRRFHHALAGCG